ncbi:hypothetical protein PCH70_22460 [Pseudomonas cichorii JBC1]|nr:hypothetical protein PCH70_22460 [Pseudomonas cichorii JBC1]
MAGAAVRHGITLERSIQKGRDNTKPERFWCWWRLCMKIAHVGARYPL